MNYNILIAVLKILTDLSKSPFLAILIGGLRKGVLFVGVTDDLPETPNGGGR